MSTLTVGLGVFVVLAGLVYGAAWLAPEPRSEADLDKITAKRGPRVAERFRQMDEQRRLTVNVGKVVLPVAIVAFVIALLVDLVA